MIYIITNLGQGLLNVNKIKFLITCVRYVTIKSNSYKFGSNY